MSDFRVLSLVCAVLLTPLAASAQTVVVKFDLGLRP
jgi:hypothetical protein